jgi:hypothetical protein
LDPAQLGPPDLKVKALPVRPDPLELRVSPERLGRPERPAKKEPKAPLEQLARAEPPERRASPERLGRPERPAKKEPKAPLGRPGPLDRRA